MHAPREFERYVSAVRASITAAKRELVKGELALSHGEELPSQ
jgi:hypothetical protein